jgi:hypothetical protein
MCIGSNLSNYQILKIFPKIEMAIRNQGTQSTFLIEIDQ